jgi:hypothetical protein
MRPDWIRDAVLAACIVVAIALIIEGMGPPSEASTAWMRDVFMGR